MRKLLLTVPLFCMIYACAQTNSYTNQIQEYRNYYKQEFLNDERSPLKAEDTSYLKFFTPDEDYKVTANVTLTPDAKPFEIPTVSGKTKTYRQYATLSFTLKDTTVELLAYQSLKLLKETEHKSHLFIPFTDATTYTETYGGGRYIDLSTEDIIDNKIEIDFNKCYNPWCAYADGYSCPIPPKENRLPVAIRAGEKNYAKAVKH